MRPQKYRTHYKIGSKDNKAVYWHPSEGYSIEEDHSYLVKLSDLNGVTLDPESKIRADLESSYGRLREAMTRELKEAFDALEDELWSECCDRERDRLIELANPSLTTARQ